MTAALARFCSGRVHYAWVALVVMFTVTLGAVGVRAAPGVMIVPLQQRFGWSVGTISAAISLNIILLGITGPFITGLMETFGLKRTILRVLGCCWSATGLVTFMTSPWQLFLTWGLLVGDRRRRRRGGHGGGCRRIAGSSRDRGLAMGLLSSANAAGQLIFLPLLGGCSPTTAGERVDHGDLAIAAVIPLLASCCRSRPATSGSDLWHGRGSRAVRRAAATRSRSRSTALFRGVRSLDFWLLAPSFGVCGFSTNGLISTHLIAFASITATGVRPAPAFSPARRIQSDRLRPCSGWLYRPL